MCSAQHSVVYCLSIFFVPLRLDTRAPAPDSPVLPRVAQCNVLVVHDSRFFTQFFLRDPPPSAVVFMPFLLFACG